MSPARRALWAFAALTGCVCLLAAWLISPVAEAGTLHVTIRGREIELLDPRGLYALALLPVVLWAPTWSLSDLPSSRRALSTLLRTLVIAALALALSRPAELATSTLTSTVFVVDVSSSIDDATLARMAQRVEAAYRARGPHHVELVTFAADARRIPFTPDGPLELSRHADGNGTDMERALSLAMGLFEPGRLRQVALLGDGRETRGQLSRAAERLSRQGVVLLTETPSGALPAEVAIRDLVLPDTIRVGEPFMVRVRFVSTVAQRVRVRLFQNELLNGLDGARDLELRAGETELSLRSIVRVGGPVTYRAELSPQGPDRFAENNRFERSVVVRGKPRVLYVEGAREQAGAFSDMLRAAGFEVEVRSASSAPTALGELSTYDFYVLSNVSRDALAYSAMNAIERFVQDGGGFLMAGGNDAFGLGGYRGSKLEDLLPVRLDTERRRDQPTLALALVIDKSGSMSGPKMELAKEAARATAELLSSEDYLGVIGFDAEPTRLVRLGTVSNRVAIGRGIGKLTSGGGTAIFPALDAAYADLSSVRARIKHVILLTDGQTQEDGLPLLVQNMQIDNITVSTIGLGDDVNRSLLEELSRVGNGRAYFTSDPSHVPRLFMKETHAVARSSAVEDYVTARLVAPADFMKSVPLESAPFLRGYVATRPRTSPAQVILESDLGEPLLARMRVGLGWSLAWTSDVTPRWSADWFRWSGFSALWAQLVREHMRKDASDELAIEAHAEGDELVATLDALDEAERFMNGLSGELQIRHVASQHERTVPVRQVAPGRYEARAPLDRYGTFVLRGVLRSEGRPVRVASGNLAHPFPTELSELTPAPERLLEAALWTGGGPLPEGAQLFAPKGRHLTFPVERWNVFAWTALVLFVLDVASRRLRAQRR